ncbi:MAG: CBS domain-containing protein [Burkholderiales bacterium]|nr:CBS domain-containing protein [Burkholderiales bacterium]
MFSIYGESGRIFRGAMEDLWRVEALRAAMRTRRLQAHEPATGVLGGAGQAVLPVSARSHAAGAALSAYAQAGHLGGERHPLSRVADVMSRQVTTVGLEMTVLQAWQLLGQQGMGQAPVLSQVGELVGLLTRAELLNLERLPRPDAPALVWRALLLEPVAAVMLSPVPAVSEDTDLRRVARVLLDTRLPGLPVVSEEGQLAGFISRSDILKAVVHDPPLDLWS